jgi:hypothetical protein
LLSKYIDQEEFSWRTPLTFSKIKQKISKCIMDHVSYQAPGIHCYVAGSIPAVTPRYCTKKIEKCSLEHKKTKEKKCIMELKRNILVILEQTRQ